MYIMRNIIIAIFLVAFMASCSSTKNSCTSKEATKYLTNSLNNFHKVKVELVTENTKNCNYLYSVKSKEFENGVTYMVTRTKGKWTYTIMTK